MVDSDRLKVVLILALLILCALPCKSHSHTNDPPVNANICHTALLDYKGSISWFFESIEKNNIDELLEFKNVNFDIYANYQMGHTFLNYASFLGRSEVIHALISELEVDVNTKDKNDLTALHYAALNPDMPSRIDTIYTLIQLGADIKVLDHIKIPSWYIDIRQEKNLPLKYSLEQKEKAVELALSISTLQQAAKLLQINYRTLGGWVRQYKVMHNIPIQEYNLHSHKFMDKAIKMVIEDKMTVRQVANDLDVSEAAVSNWVFQYKEEHNIPTKEYHYKSQDTIDKVIRMVIEEGLTQKLVAEELGISEGTVSGWITEYKKRHNIKMRRYYSQKLKEKASRIVVEGIMNITEVARRLKVSEMTVLTWIRQYKKKYNIKMKPRYSKETKNKAIRMVTKNNMPLKQVAEKLNISRNTIFGWVHQHRRKHNIQVKGPYSDELKTKIIEMVIEDNISIKQVAKKQGISVSSISTWVNQHIKAHNIQINRITHHSQELRARAIKMVIQSNITIRQTAEELGISASTISGWVNQYKERHNMPVYAYYSQETKNEALKIIVENNMTMAQVARKLKISARAISKWVRQYEEEHDLIIRNGHYPQEFKDEAVEMVIEDKMPVRKVAKDFGINERTLFRWRKKHRREHKVEDSKLPNLKEEATVEVY